MAKAVKNFYNAVEMLASGTEYMKERLITAYNYSLSVLPKEELPEDLQNNFEALLRTLSDQGNVYETVGRMSDEETSMIARKIVSLYAETAQKVYREV